MHAIVGVFDMSRGLFAEQQRHLKERIVPTVQKVPGFIAGYWSYDHSASKAHSYIVVEDEVVAARFCDMVRGSTQQEAHGVRIDSLTTVEVVAEARK